jgi:hypothetical protein
MNIRFIELSHKVIIDNNDCIVGIAAVGYPSGKVSKIL